MNAIIAAATGYSDTALDPFLASVERVCAETKVFLIVLRRDLERIELLRRKYPFIEPVCVRRKLNTGARFYSWMPRWIAREFIDEDYSACGPVWRGIGRYALHIMLDRFFLALEIVQTNRGTFDNVLLTDSRDVVLQGDPFGFIGDHVVSGLEEKVIGCCPVNAGWLAHLYGNDVAASMSQCRISCAGVTFGPTGEVERYLIEMCREIWQRLPRVALGSSYDQAIHNYLIYTGKVNVKVTDNAAGIIATLHYEDPSNIKTDAEGGVVTVRGQPPAIVHQYDRHASVVAFVRERLDKRAVVVVRGC
jgi:hypothetical protein